MKLPRSFLAAAAPLALLALGGCAEPFAAKVARFQMMPPPTGQTFVVQPRDPRDQGSLEFAHYADIVRQHLAALGYQPAAGPQGASLVVSLDYGVDRGQQKIVSTPGFGGYGPFGYGGFGYGGFGGFGYGRFGRGYAFGWNDPFLYGGWGGPRVDSYTVYTSHLELNISRTADNERLFEGRARARSASDDLTTLVPNLVDAMFTGFPGNSGEDVRITVPPPRRG